MEQLIITIEGKSNADLIMQLMNKFNFVKSVIREKKLIPNAIVPPDVNEAAETYNWVNPTRPASDEEFEQLALEMDNEHEEYSSIEVVNFAKEELKSWRKKKK